jgi:hypothetical protein
MTGDIVWSARGGAPHFVSPLDSIENIPPSGEAESPAWPRSNRDATATNVSKKVNTICAAPPLVSLLDVWILIRTVAVWPAVSPGSRTGEA